MDRTRSVQEALEPIRMALDADGGTLEVLECANDRLTVGLLLRPDACDDCLLPPAQLELMVADAVGDVTPGFHQVRVQVSKAGDARDSQAQGEGHPQGQRRPRPSATLPTHTLDGEQEAIDDFFYARGWSDGLPIVAPTRARVEAALEAADLEPGDVIGPVPVSNRVLDAQTLAVNAVMAGCRPEHLRALKAFMAAVLQEPFNLAGVSATTHPAGPMAIMSGDVCEALSFNSGAGSLGPGNRANATIGRAMRLILYTVGGAQPGVGDKATIGHPGKYTYVLAENQAESPWEPLRARLGGRADGSTLTAVAAEAPRNVNDHGSATPSELIRSLAGTIASLGHNNLHRGGPIVVVVGPEHAAVLGRGGVSAADLCEALFERAQVPLASIPEANLQRMRKIQPEHFRQREAIGTAPVTLSPEDFIPVVSGGPGRHSMMIPSFGISQAVTVSID